MPMSTRSAGTRSKGRIAELVALVNSAPSQELIELVRLAELDPAVHFRFGDWSGLDARGANLRDFDFTGAVLAGARFDRALIGPGISANGEPSRGACFDGAVVGLQGHMSSIANILSASDYSDYLDGWQHRPDRDSFTEAFEVGDIFRDAPFAPTLVVVPPGTVEWAPYYAAFEDYWDSMRDVRSSDALRGRQSNLFNPRCDVYKFAVATHPTTVAEWETFERQSGRKVRRSISQDSDRDRPVTSISWHDASAFADWLTGRCGKQYRLLSESEAEHCLAAGGEKISASFRRLSSSSTDLARRRTPALNEVNIVSAANAWGLHFARPSLLEWCCETWSTSPAQGGSPDEPRRVCRGADTDEFETLRLSYRDGVDKNAKLPFVGFRVARVLN